MKTNLMLAAFCLCILFACKKKTEEIIPTPEVDPLVGDWYLTLPESANLGNVFYAFRENIVGNITQGNLGLTSTATAKILFKITQVIEGKYSIGIANGFAGQKLIFQTPGNFNYLLFGPSTGATNEQFTFTKNADNSYLIKPVSDPTLALSASIISGTTLKANYITAGGGAAAFQKWKLEK